MPTKPTSPSVNTGHAMAANLAAYFLMREGSGTTTVDLIDGNVGTFAGSPT
jgi:hypothetical protein